MSNSDRFHCIYKMREAARKMVRLSKVACMIAGKAEKANLKYRIYSFHTTHMVSAAYSMLEDSQKAFDDYSAYYEAYRSGSETPSAWINTRLQDFIDAHFLPDVPPRDSWFEK